METEIERGTGYRLLADHPDEWCLLQRQAGVNLPPPDLEAAGKENGTGTKIERQIDGHLMTLTGPAAETEADSAVQTGTWTWTTLAGRKETTTVGPAPAATERSTCPTRMAMASQSTAPDLPPPPTTATQSTPAVVTLARTTITAAPLLPAQEHLQMPPLALEISVTCMRHHRLRLTWTSTLLSDLTSITARSSES